jgi:large subunit ribosomal protein L28e
LVGDVISGLANKKTVTVQPAADKEMTVVLSTTKSKKQNKPAAFSHKTVMRKEFRKMAKAVKNQVIALDFNVSFVDSWYWMLLSSYLNCNLFWKCICGLNFV